MIKNILTKKVSLLLLGVVFAVSAFAQTKNVKDLVPAKFYDELMRDGYILRARREKDNVFQLLPKSQYSDRIINGAIKKEDNNFAFTYEGLYYLSKADILEKSNSSKKTITIDDVAKVCRSVSKMEGMTYYSNSRKKNMVLYKDAYMIDKSGLNERNPEPIPDQNMGNANGQVSYCLQNDASFGKNKYRLSYFQSGDELFTEFLLMDKMGKGPFNALYPGKMKINLLVIDCGEDLLLYLCTDLDSKRFPGIENIIVDSMTARMEAVYNWFITQF